MADLDPTSRKLAKRLAALTAQAGDSVLSEIQPALDRLVGKRPLAERKAFYRAFLNYLRREIRAGELRIQHAGAVEAASIDAIAQTFTQNNNRSYKIVTEESPELISGLRIILGDNIFDASVAGRLQRLAESGS